MKVRGIYEPEDCACGQPLYADDEFATGVCHRCLERIEDAQRQGDMFMGAAA